MGDEPIWVANVRKLRTAKGWSQGELATRAGFRGNTLSAALNGRTSPRLNTLEKLVGAEALNIPMWRLFVDDRQAEILQRQQAADAAIARESDIEARVEQRLLGKYAELVKEAIAEERSGQPVAPDHLEPAEPATLAPVLVPQAKRIVGRKAR